MAKKEQKSSLESDKVDQGNKPSTKTPKKEGKLSLTKGGKLLPALIVVLLIVVAVGAAFILMNRDSGEGSEVTEEPALTHAEELELRKLTDNADQDDHNTVNLRLANAYYREGNYKKALEYLELIENPSDQITSSYNTLYGEVLNGLGREDEALQYNQAALEARESGLLVAVEQDPSAYYDLGMLYANAGQTDKAIESYQKLIDTYNNAPEEGVEYLDEEIVELTKQAIEELQ